VIGSIALRRWFPALVGCGLTLALLMILLSRGVQVISAQQQAGIEVEKQLLKSGNIVRVGEILTFAITITNRWDANIVTLPLSDDYDESILRFVDATLPPDTHDVVSGALEWNNVLASSGPLAPGQQIVITVRFVAEHPTADLRVVNRAQTHDAYDDQQRQVGDGGDSASGDADGGRTPITKTLDLRQAQPLVGRPITYTIAIGNDGLANVVRVPLSDSYDPATLQYWRAVPPPDQVAPGELRWSNLLQPPLASVLTPGEVVTATVVFTALREIDQTVNRVNVAGASDSFGNDLEAGQAEAPIRILPNPDLITPTATPQPSAAPRPTLPPTPRPAPPDEDEPTATPELAPSPTPSDAPTSTPTTPAASPTADTPSATVAPTAAPAAPTSAPAPTAAAGARGAPRKLPDTGASSSVPWLLSAIAALLIALGLLSRRRGRDSAA
jgi:LPXTG-motif cell wall-anchored protein